METLDEATTKKVKQSAADFIQEIDRMKVSQEVDRAKISAAYMQHTSKLIGGELGAKLDNALKGMVAAVQNVRKPPSPPVAPPGAVGDNGDMDKRIDRLETDMRDVRDRLARVETNVVEIKANYATKEDLAHGIASVNNAINDQTWKVIGWVTTICTLLVAAVYFISKHST